MQVHHAVGAILVKEGQILLGKRSPNRAFYPGLWDVLGGHVEPNETPDDTLIRELKEEVGVEPTKWSHLETITATAEDQVFECRLYVVTGWSGTPSNRQPEEHTMIQWFSLQLALCLELADPRYRFILVRAVEEAGERPTS